MLEPLSTDRIILTKFKEADSPPIYQAITHSATDISPWVTWLSPHYDLKKAEDFVAIQIKNWQDNTEFSFVINDLNNHLLGVISLYVFHTANDVANIGYWMNSAYTRKGYCTEAVKLLAVNALKQLNLIRIELVVGVDNIASQKVAEKSGAHYEGVLKNRIRYNGTVTDAKLYAFFDPTG